MAAPGGGGQHQGGGTRHVRRETGPLSAAGRDGTFHPAATAAATTPCVRPGGRNIQATAASRRKKENVEWEGGGGPQGSPGQHPGGAGIRMREAAMKRRGRHLGGEGRHPGGGGGTLTARRVQQDQHPARGRHVQRPLRGEARHPGRVCGTRGGGAESVGGRRHPGGGAALGGGGQHPGRCAGSRGGRCDPKLPQRGRQSQADQQP